MIRCDINGQFYISSLAVGAFPTPRIQVTVDASGKVSVVNEYGEPVKLRHTKRPDR